MARKSETIFKDRIMPRLRDIPYSWWDKIQQVSIVGSPDIYGCINGIFIAIELKKDAKSKISELQKYKLKNIDEAGGVALILFPENFEVNYKKLLKLSKGEKNATNFNLQESEQL